MERRRLEPRSGRTRLVLATGLLASPAARHQPAVSIAYRFAAALIESS
jgi:hypothetical protein